MGLQSSRYYDYYESTIHTYGFFQDKEILINKTDIEENKVLSQIFATSKDLPKLNMICTAKITGIVNEDKDFNNLDRKQPLTLMATLGNTQKIFMVTDNISIKNKGMNMQDVVDYTAKHLKTQDFNILNIGLNSELIVYNNDSKKNDGFGIVNKLHKNIERNVDNVLFTYSEVSDIPTLQLNNHYYNYNAMIQTYLKSFGYKINIDGIYGEQTFNAIKRFQSKNDLTEDGIAGNETFSCMMATDNERRSKKESEESECTEIKNITKGEENA